MGACLSVKDENAAWLKWGTVLITLNLTRGDFRKLLSIFNRMDKDGSGSIALKELLLFLKMEDSSFMDRAFSIFDSDRSGEIDFGEFVVCVWNYCTEDRTSFLMFAFDLYDSDRSGFLSKEEIKSLLKDVFGTISNKFVRSQVAKIVAAVDRVQTAGQQGLNFQEFSRLTKSYPSLLSSAFELHRQIQNKLLGVRYWEKMAAMTVEFEGASMTTSEFKEKVPL
jgi:serine/threonine-protein phosphatase 2B regulatory subunit